MGKYHPHGDSSIYDALVHMTEEYSLSVPLVDGHGNFGSIDGDGAAAMRYTEARLSKGAMMLLSHLEKGLVDFIPNFDDSEKEPTVLPAMIPNLLINGTMGIAVGMATNIPPHNPGEVIDGVIAYMDHPSITTEELMEYIMAPDFPTGGTIINRSELRNIYETGEGKIKIRAKTEIEKGENGRQNIIITEVPYTIAGNKTRLIENLSLLMKDKVFDEIYDVRDESSKEGIRIVIEVKKDRDIDNLLNGLYKKTSMEDTYGVNLLAIKDQQPVTFTLKSLISEFVKFQEELYTKEYRHLLNKGNQRLEIVDGLIKATDLIDLIIEVLRGSSSVKQAKNCLVSGEIKDISFKSTDSKLEAARFDFTERQADAILAMPLSKLIGLEIIKLHEEGDGLRENIREYEKVLGDQKELYKIIKGRLKEFKKLFQYPRKTKLAELENTGYVEEFKVEEITVLIDRFGYTKSLDSGSFTRISKETLKEYPYVISMQNVDKLCLFTAEGNMYQVKAEKIPKCKIKDKGTLIHSLCKVDKEDIILYTSFEELFESQLLFVTQKGFVKLVSGAEFETIRGMIAATKLDEEDKVVSITKLSAQEAISGNQKVILITEKQLSLGFALTEVSELKKTSRGIKGISLENNDKVDFASCVEGNTEEISYNGKILNAKKIRNRKRGAKGQKAQL
ncbi:MAG: DNA gyrase subunit A, partial [Acetivibrio sp.]